MSPKLKLFHVGIILSFLILHPISASSFQSTDQKLLKSGIRSGQLPNGFTYFIKPLYDTSSKVDMRLIIKVGHQNENPNQFQFAHLLEHIAISEVRQKFPNLLNDVENSLVNTPARVTSDFTSYGIVLDSRQKNISSVGLSYLKNKLNLDLRPEEIEKEIRTILNEANGGLRDKFLLITDLESDLIGGNSSRPNDFANHLFNIKPDTLIQFYDKWYRPNLMALVIVGDINNIDQIEREIENVFYKNLPRYETHNIQGNDSYNYLNRKPTFLKEKYSTDVTDKNQIKNNLIRLYWRQKIKDGNFTQILEHDLVRNLMVPMLTRRYNEKQEAYNTNYNIFPNFLDPTLAFKLNISINGNTDKKVVQNAVRAVKEVEYFGFTAQEFTQSKQDLLNHIRNMDTTTTSYWVNEITDHYVFEKSIVHNKKEQMENLLKRMTLHNFNKLVKSYLEGQPDDIITVSDIGDPILKISEKNMRGWISEVESLSIKPYSSPQVPNFLLDPTTISGLKESAYKIKESSIPGAKEYVLPNGLRIILKSFSPASKLTPENNLIYFQGIVKKGTSCFSEDDYFSALNAPEVVINSGVGGLDKFDLDRYLKSQKFEGRVYPYIDQRESGIKGSIKLKELEAALQIVYLYMTSPNFQKIAFEDWKQQTVTNSQHKNINREDFNSFIKAILTSKDSLPIGTRAMEGIEKTDFERASKIYQQLFKDPHNFTFMFTGDFPEEEVLNLGRKYLGNIPREKENSMVCNVDLVRRKLPTKHIIKSMLPTQPTKLAMVRISYITSLEESGLNWREQIKTELLRQAISTLVIEHLRFKAGLIYQSGGGLNYERFEPFLEFFIEYECLPENIEESILVSKNLINILNNQKISEPIFNELKRSALSSLSEVDSYRTTLKKMHNKFVFEESWVEKSEKRKYIKSLTSHDLLKAAQKYLRHKPFEFTMVPNINYKSNF